MENINEELKKHKFVIFGSDHYNTLGTVRSLGEAGFTPDIILHPAYSKHPHLSNNSKYVGKVFIVDTVEEGYDVLIREYGNEPIKPFVYSCDDYVESYLDLHHNEICDKFYYFNGLKPGLVTRYMDKDAISQLAVECGCQVPKSEILKKGELPKTLRYPVITKSIMSIKGGWKSDVRICYSAEQLSEEYKTIKSEDLLVEEFIEKDNELCLDGFSANNGQDVCIPFQSTYIRVKPGKYGNFMDVTPFTNEKVMNQVKAMMAKSGFNGIFSVEYLIDKKGELWFLEVNFRNSTWSYAFTVGGCNMLYEWAKAQILGHIDHETINQNVRKTTFKALVEFNDFKDFVLSGDISIWQWIKDLRSSECLYYWGRNDRKPMYIHFRNVILRRLKLMK